MVKKTNKTEKTEVKAPVTRAEKTNATKNLIKELLAVKPYRHNELIDEVAKSYVERFGEETDNINDVKGRVGSVLDIMKKESDVMYDGGRYALKARSLPEPLPAPVPETAEKQEEKTEKPAPKRGRAKAKKEPEEKAKPKAEEKPAKKTTRAKTVRKTKTAEAKTEEPTKDSDPLPVPPLQPIAPVAPVTPETAPEPIPEEKPAPKKRGRKPKASKELEGQTELDLHELEVQLPIEAETLVEVKTENEAPMSALTEEKVEDAQKEISVAASAETPVERVEALEDVLAIAMETPVETPAETTAVENVESVGNEKNAEEKNAPVSEMKPVSEIKEEKTQTSLQVKEKAEVAPKNVVMDMSFLFGDVKPARQPRPVKLAAVETPAKEEKVEKEEKAAAIAKVTEQPKAKQAPQAPATEKKVLPVVSQVKKLEPPKAEPAPKTTQKLAEKTAKAERIPEQKKAERIPEQKTEEVPVRNQLRAATSATRNTLNVRRRSVAERALTPDEKLREAFLKRMRSLGGDYFEYYSVYLLERYSMKNGRRLEGLKITGGGHDGGIDGEIELTDKFGFKETIYIQSKNWDPDKGDEKLWVVGETLLQQFIGACACRQAKQGKLHCRGIFVTTSRFTPEAKHILDDMSDKLVGYDGADLYEAAKECQFGIIKKNGEWALDEQLLSGTKAFFNML